MVRYKGLLGLLFAVAVLLAPLANAQEQDEVDSHARIVRLSYVDGGVQIAGDRVSGYENATLNMPISERDQLRTGTDGRVEVQFEDGSTIRLAPESQITFAELGRLSSGATVTSIDLDSGEAEFQVNRHSDDSIFAIHASQRVITLKHSSRFRVTSTNSDPLEVVVWKGEVSLRDPDSDKEIAIKKDETFALDAMDTGHYDLEKSAEADDLDGWSSEREHYLSSYASNATINSPYQYGVSDLNYYGQYYNVPGYGYCWQPYGVNLGWDPFMNGYWSYSPQFGYLWVSAYPWGWMPYRYGHWVFLNGYGWLWQPGNFGFWSRVPHILNPPSGFHAPVPPASRAAGPASTPAGSGFAGGTSGRLNPGRGFRSGDGNRPVITNDNFPGRTEAPAVVGQHGEIHDRRIRPETEASPAVKTQTQEPSQPVSPARTVVPTPVTPRTVTPVTPPSPRSETPSVAPSRTFTPPPAPSAAPRSVSPPASPHSFAPAPAPSVPHSFSPPAVSHSSGSGTGHSGPR